MKLDLTWGKLAEVARGRLARGRPGAPFDAFSTDSRTVREGETFWALKGQVFDGHDFLSQTIEREIGGWVIREGACRPEHGAPAPGPPQVLEVPHTLTALKDLASFHRGRFNARVVAVTGTNGKTTTKEMIGAICRAHASTCVSPGNLNNHFGLPLSVLEMLRHHALAVFELGASRLGEISELTKIARPCVGVLTNISAAHLEFFGSLEAVLEAKKELIDNMETGGTVVLNLDDDRLAPLAGRIEEKVITFGTKEGAHVRCLTAQHVPGRGTHRIQNLRLEVYDKRMDVRLNALGKANGLNAAAAAAAAVALRIPLEAVCRGLESFRPPAMRMEIRNHPSEAVLLVDAYNANPASMLSGLSGFCDAFPKEKKYAVLGEMKELGGFSEQLHRELGKRLKEFPIEKVFLVGDGMRAAAAAMGATEPHSPAAPCRFSADVMALRDEIKSQMAAGTAFFFKASRALQLEKLIEQL